MLGLLTTLIFGPDVSGDISTSEAIFTVLSPTTAALGTFTIMVLTGEYIPFVDLGEIFLILGGRIYGLILFICIRGFLGL